MMSGVNMSVQSCHHTMSSKFIIHWSDKLIAAQTGFELGLSSQARLCAGKGKIQVGEPIITPSAGRKSAVLHPHQVLFPKL